MTDEEMQEKLKKILMEDDAQQMNFPFLMMNCEVEDNSQYLLFEDNGTR